MVSDDEMAIFSHSEQVERVFDLMVINRKVILMLAQLYEAY